MSQLDMASVTCTASTSPTCWVWPATSSSTPSSCPLYTARARPTSPTTASAARWLALRHARHRQTPAGGLPHDVDTLELLKVAFTDVSWYEPEVWHWDFGDGSTSSEVNPVHVFPASGTYTVCMTVSNQYSSDTVCREVTVGVSATEGENGLKEAIRFFPNPAHLACNILISEDVLLGEGVLRIYTAMGQPVHTQRLMAGWSVVGLEGLAKGMYFWEVRDNDRVLGTGKLVKVE
ncbi:MAG: PKD domain-containing protein [Saprospiraceae bacterium]|nr:PKD domain-containing protein [Saprospiraceae bacterium]